jgi:hypothetical protein
LKELLASEGKPLTSLSLSSTTEQRRREVKIKKVD